MDGISSDDEEATIVKSKVGSNSLKTSMVT